MPHQTRPASGRAAHYTQGRHGERNRTAEFQAKHRATGARSPTAEIPSTPPPGPASTQASDARRADTFDPSTLSPQAASAWKNYAANPNRTWREFDRLLSGDHGPALVRHDREIQKKDKDAGFLGREAFKMAKQALEGPMSAEDLAVFAASQTGAHLLQNTQSPLGGFWSRLRQPGTIRSWVNKLPGFLQTPARMALVTFARYGLSGLAGGAKAEWLQGIVQHPLFAQVKDGLLANVAGKQFEGGPFAKHLFELLERYGSGKEKLKTTRVAADALDLAITGASTFAMVGEKLGPEKLEGLVKGAAGLADFLRKLDFEKLLAQFAGMTGQRQQTATV